MKVLPKYTTILHGDEEMSRKFDVRNSHQDRCDLVQSLLTLWRERAEQYQRRKAQKEKARTSARTLSKTRQYKTTGGEGYVASRVIDSHRGRPLKDRQTDLISAVISARRS